MDVKSEIFTRDIWSIIVVIVTYKIFGKLIYELFTNIISPHKKENKLSLDEMIAKQKIVLSGNRSDGSDKKEATPVTNIQNVFHTHPDKKFLELLECLKWGTGNPLENIRKKAKQETSIDFEIHQVSKAASTVIKDESLTKLNRNDIITYSEFELLVINYLIMSALMQEVPRGGGNVIGTVGKNLNRYHLTQSIVLEIFSLASVDSLTKYKHIISRDNMANKPLGLIAPDKLKHVFNTFLYTEDKKSVLPPKDLVSRLCKNIQVFEALEPIPDIDKTKIDLAYRLFNATPETPKEKIKERYKKLASIKHPDRLLKFKLPEEMKKIATDNFSNLQKAYELIKE